MCAKRKAMLGIFKEFRAFINRGNVMGLAIAVIMGGAFNAIITSLVGDLISPLISLLTGGIDYSSLSISFGESSDAATLRYGMVIQAVLNFLLVAIVIFFMVKAVNKIAKKEPEEDVPETTCPYCGSTIFETAVRCPCCTTVLDASKLPEALR
jgi:large conductance mechanosensitive channel